MPESSFSAEEVEQLLKAVFSEEGRSTLDGLLAPCHEWTSPHIPAGIGLPASEKYFRKRLRYRDYNLDVRQLVLRGDCVVVADFQFRRPSRFPAPFLNRNRSLFRTLRSFLAEQLASRPIEVKGNDGQRQVHFRVRSHFAFWSADSSFEDWKSECALYDEPFSSGSVDPDATSTRNDFIIIRYNRHEAQSEGHSD